MATALKLMSVDEFLPWTQGREGRWELHDGVPVMMSPEQFRHIRVKLRAANALQAGIDAAGLPCEAITDGLTIRIDADTAFEPDASVVCGPPRSDDTVSIDDPMIVVEVLSPSTAAVDLSRKLRGYFSLPSVQHYLVIDPERRTVIHHRRGQGGAVEKQTLREGLLRLDPPGFDVEIERLFVRTR